MKRRLKSPFFPVAAALVALALAAPGSAWAQEDDGRTQAQASEGTPVGPAVLAVVSLRHQRVSVYDAEGRAVRAKVSSGQSDYETPVGVYAILQKNKDHYSNLYDDASMPFMQRLTWSGIALHAGALPGYPASHGCVRLPYNYAEQIFALSKIGTRVVVARDDTAPVEISHPKLFQPVIVAGEAPQTPKPTPIAYELEGAGTKQSPFEPDLTNWPGRQAQMDALRPAASQTAAAAEQATAKADEVAKVHKEKAAAVKKLAKPLRRAERAKEAADKSAEQAARRLADAKTEKTRKQAETRAAKAAEAVVKAETALAEIKAKHEAAEAEAARAAAELDVAGKAKAAAVAAASEARRKMLPVSVFVSLKTQRAYVRQGHEAVFDMPVTISNPEIPIGTYVYTAVDYADGGNGVRWTAVSLPPRAPDDYGAFERKRRSSKDTPPPPTDEIAAKAALDRITFPPEFVTRVSGYVWPRSSLIVSDEEASKETGNATDFVVLIGGEPQGGIKKRPRQPPPGYYGYDYYVYGDDDYYDRRSRRRPRYYNAPFFSFW